MSAKCFKQLLESGVKAIYNSHIGKTCPYCQYPVKYESEVAVCFGCSIPHHRECWEVNSGCTTFGCQGSSGEVYHSRGSKASIGSNRIVIDDLSDVNDLNYESGLKDSMTYTYTKANYGKRIGAYIIDSVIAHTPTLLLHLYIGLIFFVRPIDYLADYEYEMLALIAILLLSHFWAILFLLIRDCLFNGQSPGKKMFGLMVVYLYNNQPCTIGLSFKRNFLLVLLLVLSLLIIIPLPLEYLIPLFHNKGQRLGDMIAKTQVIEVNQYRDY